MKTLKNIVTGWFYFALYAFGLIGKQHINYAMDRKKICNACPFKKAGICKVCGCGIWAKVFCLECECPESKW